MKTPKLPPEAKRAIKQMMRHESEINSAAAEVMGGFCGAADTPARFTITLGDDVLAFEFGARAHFRMGTADHPFDLTDCGNPKRAHAATVSWLWACLSREDAAVYENPEDLAEAIPLNRMLECTKALIKAIADYNASRKEANDGPEATKATPAKSDV